MSDWKPTGRAVTDHTLAAVVEALGEQVGLWVRTERERADALEKRLAAVEVKQLSFCGTWQSSGEYARGNLAVHKGALWHANETTRTEPGRSRAWQLAVKQGEPK